MTEKKKFNLDSFKRAGEMIKEMNQRNPLFGQSVEIGAQARLSEISGGQPEKISPKTQIAFIALQGYISDPNVPSKGLSKIVDDLNTQATAGGFVARSEDIDLSPSQVDDAFDKHREVQGGNFPRWGAILNYRIKGEPRVRRIYKKIMYEADVAAMGAGGVRELYQELSDDSLQGE